MLWSCHLIWLSETLKCSHSHSLHAYLRIYVWYRHPNIKGFIFKTDSFYPSLFASVKQVDKGRNCNYKDKTALLQATGCFQVSSLREAISVLPKPALLKFAAWQTSDVFLKNWFFASFFLTYLMVLFIYLFCISSYTLLNKYRAMSRITLYHYYRLTNNCKVDLCLSAAKFVFYN